uniref:acetyl-CoA carboxylase biotin carboxylase subunit n=1 Tax=Rickettsiales endosymbiont of Peranema trichophorum TaxID=2486577 RepID=UPI001F5CE13D|nr:acetyl-CoA carboxylase biotin carboxylase subunit [Rickettsiales endosymbiont of Peranema trichophorum]
MLIANRGEIACRIIRTAKEMSIETVAVYSEADTNALHVKLADTAVYIGSSPSPQSYLNQHHILDAIKISGADCVHPGYGFLSENSEFVERLEKLKIHFIGPSAYSIKMMGDKIEAKKIAKNAGVSIVPGYIGAIKSEKEALKIAYKIGYPIMLKAAAGGGGKGIRVVRGPEEMKQAFRSTTNEAKNNFADGRTFIEKFIEDPRHIEIQLIGDKYGNYICIGERECSIQRHHQKVIEEAPSIFIDDKTRKKMYKQAISLAKEVKYCSAGTIEYIVDSKKNFYFLEMNTRLQVEHPVTELISGVDIVSEMIKVAAGEKLQIKQQDIVLNGWAMESRIYAEDPTCGFLPSTGRVHVYKEPRMIEGMRIDTGIYEGGEVSMFYDAMIAKLCVHAPTRSEAIAKMKDALGQFVIRGISHNISFLQSIYNSDRFMLGDISTNFIEQEYKGGFTGAVLNDEQSAIILCTSVFVALTHITRATSISGQLRGRSRAVGTRWVASLDEKNYTITVRPIEDGYKISFENRRFYITSKWVLGSKLLSCKINGEYYNVQVEHVSGLFYITYMGSTVKARLYTPRAAELVKYMPPPSTKEKEPHILANISGLVRDIKVEVNDKIVKGQPIVVIEAMKMENILVSNVDGKVQELKCAEGDIVSAGDTLIMIEQE